MIKKVYIDIDVVTMARKRIKNAFSNGVPVRFSVSGGKDSICLNALLLDMVQSGDIDKNLLVVDFVDEEAMFPCVIRIVEKMRRQWLSIGVKFNWWALEFKHFNCLNSLENDETFICWDSAKKGNWCRKRPEWAITSHPLFRKGDSYQVFLTRISRGSISMQGLRVSESLQRRSSIAIKKKDTPRVYPIYDWEDGDVWKFILDNKLDFPDAYLYMYQTGTNRNNMRISQFFSVDTVPSLVKMAEYYPGLFERICNREPNAYMVALYYDTELYRRNKRGPNKNQSDTTDYKKKALDLLGEPSRFNTPAKVRTYRNYKRLVLKFSISMTQKHWRTVYQALLAGDPKGRTYRALFNDIVIKIAKEE